MGDVENGPLYHQVRPYNLTPWQLALADQWLELGTFTVEGGGSIPSLGTKILQATWCRQKKKNNYSYSHFTDATTEV